MNRNHFYTDAEKEPYSPVISSGMPPSLFNANKESTSTFILMPNKKTNLTPNQCLIVLLSVNYAIGPSKNGYHLQAGIVFFTVCNIAAALFIYYSTWILLKSVSYFRSHNYESTWIARGLPFVLILRIAIALPSLGFTAFHILNIQIVFKLFWDWCAPSATEFLTDSYILGLIIGVFVLIILFKKNIRRIYIVSVIGCALIVALMCIYLYYLVANSIQYGFDPEKNLVYFIDFKADLIGAIQELLASYMSYLFTFMVLNNMIDFNLDRSLYVMKWQFIQLASVIEVFSLVDYFALLNKHTTGLLIWECLPMNWITGAGIILFFLKLMTTTPLHLYATIDTFVDMIGDDPTPFMWASLTAVFYLCAILLANITGAYFKLLSIFQNVALMFIQLIVPSLLFWPLVKEGHVHKVHWIGEIVCFLFGIGFSIVVLISSI